MILTFEAYSETLEKERQPKSEIQLLKDSFEQKLINIHKEMEPLLALKNALLRENIIKEIL